MEAMIEIIKELKNVPLRKEGATTKMGSTLKPSQE